MIVFLHILCISLVNKDIVYVSMFIHDLLFITHMLACVRAFAFVLTTYYSRLPANRIEAVPISHECLKACSKYATCSAYILIK
jgi:hypothetical protein